MFFHVSGDSGYPLEPNLLTPFGNPDNQPEERYNRCHSRTRAVIEQTFGTLKSRFRCIHKSGGTLQNEPLKCAKIAVSCMLLHNYCIQRRIPLLVENVDLDDIPDADDVQVNVGHGHGQAARRELVENVFTR